MLLRVVTLLSAIIVSEKAGKVLMMTNAVANHVTSHTDENIKKASVMVHANKQQNRYTEGHTSMDTDQGF